MTDTFYKPEEEVFCNDGRERALLKFIANHSQRHEFVNCPEKILTAIDEYGKTQDLLMNVGTYKGKIISDLIESKKPQTMLEIGGYVGYSAILFGKALRDAGGKRYMSLEQNAEFASIARSLVALAGLDDIITIVEGPCRKTLRQLSQNPEYAAPWDIIFLDHTKLAYLDDLKLCEKLELVAPGTVVLADDMIQPGNPAYSSYVRAPTSVKRHSISSLGEDGTESNDGASGNPDLVYETQMLEGLQPSGLQDAVEVSHCVRLEA